ncbi:MAG TPA: cobalamin biosynthesis protein, partial [Bradyrhizobium sp.]
LGLRLAGPRTYHGVLVDDHWMGDGRAEATPRDIDRALLIYRVAFGGALLVVAAIAVFIAGA